MKTITINLNLFLHRSLLMVIAFLYSYNIKKYLFFMIKIKVIWIELFVILISTVFTSTYLIEESVFLNTEKILQNVTNLTFTSINLVDKSTIKSFSVLFNLLTFIVLKDDEVLNKITNITKTDNNTSYKTAGDFIAEVDILLNHQRGFDNNEKFKKLEIFDKKYIPKYVRSFIDKYISPDILESTVISGRRIFRGEHISVRHVPFMAVVLIFNKFHCSGSIIHSNLVITAASCLHLAWKNQYITDNPNVVSVRVGSSHYNHGGEVISVAQISFHPGYNAQYLHNNLCVLQLLRRIQFKERFAKKIKFERSPREPQENDQNIIVAGWGTKIPNQAQDPLNDRLSYANLAIYKLSQCQDIYGKDYVNHYHICAGYITKGACNRDVGGPGLIDEVLVGVISFGAPVCGAKDAPTVFTKLGYYSDWIEHIIKQNNIFNETRSIYLPASLKNTKDLLVRKNITLNPVDSDNKVAKYYPKAILNDIKSKLYSKIYDDNDKNNRKDMEQANKPREIEKYAKNLRSHYVKGNTGDKNENIRYETNTNSIKVKNKTPHPSFKIIAIKQS